MAEPLSKKAESLLAQCEAVNWGGVKTRRLLDAVREQFAEYEAAIRLHNRDDREHVAKADALEATNLRLREQVEHLSRYAHCANNQYNGMAHGGAAVCQMCVNSMARRLSLFKEACEGLPHHYECPANSGSKCVCFKERVDAVLAKEIQNEE